MCTYIMVSRYYGLKVTTPDSIIATIDVNLPNCSTCHIDGREMCIMLDDTLDFGIFRV